MATDEIIETIENSAFPLDGADLRGLNVRNCELTYSGGLPPLLGGEITGNTIYFREEAGNTLKFLQQMLRGMNKKERLSTLIGFGLLEENDIG